MKVASMIRLGLLLALMAQSLSLQAWELDAVLEWMRPLGLGTPLSGLVTEVAVAPGQRVAEGDLLAALDQRLLRAQLDQARAAMEEAEALKSEADRELERARELFDRTVLSIHDLTLAEIDAAQAAAAARRAAAELAEAKLNLEYSVLRAPFDALVLAVLVRPGEVVSNRFEARPLVRLVELKRVIAAAQVDADVASGLQVGQPLAVSWDGASRQGELWALIPNDQGGGFRLEVAAPAPDAGVIVRGAPARIELP